MFADLGHFSVPAIQVPQFILPRVLTPLLCFAEGFL